MHPLMYIDPGTGSFFLQLLIGGSFGALLVIKQFWGRIKEALLVRGRANELRR